MQDELPDLPNKAESAPKQNLIQKIKGFGKDDKRLVKVVLLVFFGVLLLLGITASVLEKVAPRGGPVSSDQDLFTAGMWQIQPQPNQLILGFFIDANGNKNFDYQEQPFTKVSVAIRRAGETEPFRRVSADTDGLVKIDNLSLGGYEFSLDNFVEPEAETWQFFEEYQYGEEFFPTAWRKIELVNEGYKELIGIKAYQPSLLLILATDTGLVWYDPDRARTYSQVRADSEYAEIRDQDIYLIEDGKLQRFDWKNRSIIETMNWLDEAEPGKWQLSPEGKTVIYFSGKELKWRSQVEDCSEGSLYYEGLRPEAVAAGFINETSWLAVGRGEEAQPWQIFRADCRTLTPVTTIGQPISVGVLGGGDWFYSTDSSTYLVDSNGKTVKYQALGGGSGAMVSSDGRYIIKPVSGNSWLLVDYPGVKAEGVEKQYLLTNVTGELTLVGDNVYYVKAIPCEADGDCGEVVEIGLEGGGIWSIINRWDLKNVPAGRILGIIIN